MKLKEIRYSKPTYFRAEMVTDKSTEPRWIYRNKIGDVVAEGTPGAIRYRRFWGFVSTEEPDFFNTVVDRTAVVEAWPEFMQRGGNVRFMHEPNPVGRIFNGDWELKPEGVYIGASIPESERAVLDKIDAGIVHAFSLGWNSVKIMWSDESADGYTHFTKIRIVEITLCDAGATPNTDIQEERSATSPTQDEEESLFRRIYTRVVGMLNRKTAGTLPANPQEDEMTPEQFKEFMEEQRKTNAAFLGELGKINERIAQVTIPPAAPEKPPQPAEPTIEQRIAAAIKPFQDEITALKRATSTEEPLLGSITTMEQQIKAFEDAVADAAKSKELSPDQRLGFMRMSDGSPATVRGLLTSAQ